MGAYSDIEVDFIRRTLTVIDQYEAMVRRNVPESQQFEVTLLLNCLLGLLVYPQQLAKDNVRRRFDNWLTEDRVVDVGEAWGIRPSDVQSPGYKRTNDSEIRITLDQLTLRNLVRQMRNNIAHASFKVDSTSMIGQITALEFKDPDRKDRPGGFHLVLPVEHLEQFVRALANSALERLEQQKRLF
jgi:hypothetical protein